MGEFCLRIPIHSGHPFRFIPDSDSNPFRTPIPIHFGHPFQSNPDSPFGLFGLSDLEASESSGSSIFETLDNCEFSHYSPLKTKWGENQWREGDYPCEKSKKF